MVSPAKSWRKVSQAPVKHTTCFCGCGAQVEYRTNPRVYAPSCKLRITRDKARAAMESNRRARGIEAIKGTAINCSECGCVVVRNRSPRARYCRPCAAAKVLNRARRISAAKTGVKGSRVAEGVAQKLRRQTSPSHAINFRFRAAIRRVLNGGKRGRKWESLVGYTLADLMAHLERQFLKGMTWANRGEWEIDHITPLASFNFDSAEHPDFRAAWALTNLRPIWADDNRKKNRTRTHLI